MVEEQGQSREIKLPRTGSPVVERDLKPLLVEAVQTAPPLPEDRTPLVAPEGALNVRDATL